jgi:PAS domain S-box-containing protein
VNERSRYFFLLLAAMGVLLVLMALWISSSIAKPIRTVTEAIRYFKDDATGTKVTLRASGEAGVLATAFNEMTDRIVQSKRELRETWDLHQSILKTATAGFWLVSSDDRLMEVNQSYCLMSGYTEQELLGMRIGDLQAGESPVEAVQQMKQMLANGQNQFEAQHRRKDGSTFDVEINTQVLLNREGWLVVFIQDISARKKADHLLRQSLDDKRALLKEIHHRVKNNLQVITSLLRLEASRSAVDDTKQVLGYMRGRIRTMAQLHTLLYRSGTLASVDLGVYLGKVATDAIRSQELHRDSVLLTLKMGSVETGMDQATVAGLLLNELVSNCLKHGLPEGRAGEVCVELQPAHGEKPNLDGRWCLRVSDNGVGLSPDFEDKRKASLGLQLVTDLSNQLGGTVVIDSASGQGVRFSIVFTVQEPAALVMPS